LSFVSRKFAPDDSSDCEVSKNGSISVNSLDRLAARERPI